jgi:hypothetical protein
MRVAPRTLLYHLVIALLFGLATEAGAQSPGAAALTADDCVKCHAAPATKIASAGAGHKSITCLDCHPTHRPASKYNTPRCSQCHVKQPHYEVGHCWECHNDPHKPLNIKFSDNVTDPCGTCHPQQFKQIQEKVSKHSKFACSRCHSKHRRVPLCLQCHTPHSADMGEADCKNCHYAHMPTVVAFSTEVPNSNCTICHQQVTARLSASRAKHRYLSCAFCHTGRHKAIPACNNCHRSPHDQLQDSSQKCVDCHDSAHDPRH